jgi:endonuclease/exonuclease/phosphatase family metal-dependent hydrolase
VRRAIGLPARPRVTYRTSVVRLRVLTLNIWNRQGPWERRLPMIRAGIERLAPDLIGLQEVIDANGSSQADEIRAGLGLHVAVSGARRPAAGWHAAFGVAHDLGGGVRFGNAVLSRWPIAGSRVFPLPTGASDEHRSLLLAEVESPHGLVPFFVTHLNWRLHHGAVREEQVVAVAALIKREAPIRGLPPILVGDFNAEPEATEIRFLKGLHAIGGASTYFADCFGIVGDGPGVTFDARDNPFAAPTHEPPRRIDYVFVRGPDGQVRGKPLSASVVLTEVEDGVAASDHYGVLAEVSIGAK